MKEATKAKLEEAYNICEEEDRSTEYMLQFLQDYAEVDLDTVLSFLEKRTDIQRRERPEQKP